MILGNYSNSVLISESFQQYYIEQGYCYICKFYEFNSVKMKTVLRNILALIVGLVAGSLANMSIIMISGSVIAPPDGVDLSNTESLKASMHLFGPEHFVMPFLAHVIGTLIGAFLAALISASHKLLFALIMGVMFLAGGIMSVFMLPSPIWFTFADLGLAYLPMAWLGFLLASKANKQ